MALFNECGIYKSYDQSLDFFLMTQFLFDYIGLF